MNHIKKYKIFENEDTNLSLSFAITKIKEKFSESEVCDKFDNEVLEWIDSDWEDEYESEYDWYVDHNNGEAQDVIIQELINWYKTEYKAKLDIDQYSELHSLIKDEYDCLRY